MNIFSFDYPPNHGGIARLCGEIAHGLEKREKLDNVITQYYEAIGETTYPVTLTCTAKRPAREWQAYRKLKNKQPVLAGIWYPEGLIALMARNSPLVILVHGLELRPVKQRWRRKIWSRLCRCVLEQADLIVANSSYTHRLVQDIAPAATVRTNPLAVDHRRFKPGATNYLQHLCPDDKRIVSTVSRIESFKGHDTILRAIADLHPEISKEIMYLVAGKGPYLSELKKMTSELGIEEQVHFLGFVPEEELTDLYRISDLFAMCTREKKEDQNVEGFGLVFLEAQACGTPVVGTWHGGIPDAIESGNGGWLIEEDDREALSELLTKLVTKPELFEKEGEKGRGRVEQHFTWDHYTERLIKLCEDAGIDL